MRKITCSDYGTGTAISPDGQAPLTSNCKLCAFDKLVRNLLDNMYGLRNIEQNNGKIRERKKEREKERSSSVQVCYCFCVLV